MFPRGGRGDNDLDIEWLWGCMAPTAEHYPSEFGHFSGVSLVTLDEVNIIVGSIGEENV